MTVRAGARLGPVLRVGYVLALLGALGWATLIILSSASGGTLGVDYRAYDLAVDNLLAGRTMYDPEAQATGGFGLFFYPPPFALLILPVALLPIEVAVWTWTLLLVAASVAGIALLPVSARTRWVVLLLAALSWPLVYAIKLGQVGPMLLLIFAIGWRWMDRPWRLGLASGIGTVIKLQPALLVGWAVLTRRWWAAAIAIGAIAVLSTAGTIVAGPGAWFEELDLLQRVSNPIHTPHGYGVGRLLFEAGVPELPAMLLNTANTVLVLAVALFAILRASPVASFLAVAIATQFVSPVLWDHYALVLLLPVAYLIERGRWWAALIPLVTSTFLLGVNPPASYPVAFWVTLIAVLWQGMRDSREEREGLEGRDPSLARGAGQVPAGAAG
jgi:alpha-1,2-mannosyltransferase